MNLGSKKANNLPLLLCTLLGAFFVFGLIATRPAHASTGINEQINFQGRLLNAQGAVVSDGFYNIEFKIYQDGDGQSTGNSTGSPAGSLKWTEDYLNQASHGVKVVNGFLSVPLGSVTPFGSSVDWNQSVLWLSMNIAGTGSSCTPFSSCSPDGEMLPMQPMTASPYALNSGKLGGLTATNFVQLAQGVQNDSSTSSSIFINKTGSSGNILELQKSGTDLLTLSNTGALTLQNQTNSTSAFQIQNAAGTSNLFIADTTNTRIGIGATPANGLLTIGTGTTTASGGIYFGTDTDLYRSGSGNLTTDGNFISSNSIFTTNGFKLNSSSNSTGYITKLTTAGTGGVTANDVVVLNSSAQAVDTTTARDNRVYGVATTTVSSGSNTPVAISGNYQVTADAGAVAIGDQLVTSTTSGQVTVDNNATTGILGFALSSKSSGSSGLVSVSIRPINGQYTPVFRSSSDSSTAVQFLQASSGNNVLTVDTSTPQVVLGKTSSLTGKLAFATAGGGTLTINPTSNASNFTLTLPAETGTVCTTAATGTCNTAGGLSNVAYLNQDQTFTGKNTFSRNGSGAGDYSLGVTGTPAASSTSSLVRIGNAIVGGNGAANGGTYIGINEPGSGGGSAADFLNFQNNNTVELQLTSGGALTVNGTYNTNTFTSSSLQFGANSSASIASNGSNNLTVDTGSSGGTLALGANAATTNIANSNAAHTINIGSGGTSTAQAVTIGSATNTSSTLVLQGGNGSTAIALSTGNNGTAAGGIVIGNTSGAYTQTISIGTNATGSASNIIHIGDGANAQQSITIGSTSNASSSVAINAGSSGGISLGASTTLSANSNFTYASGTGGFDAHNGSGTFQTSSGNNSLNGATTVTGTNTFTVNGGATTLNGAAAGSSTAAKVNTNAASNIGLAVQGAASQTASLFQLQDSTGAYVQSVDASGNQEISSGYLNTAYGGLGSYGNLLTRSEQFDQSGGAPWTYTNVTAPSANNATPAAPDGTSTAEGLLSTASGTHTVTQTYSSAGNNTYTFSVWLSTNVATQAVQLRIDSNGTPGTGTAAAFTASTTWQRFSVTQTFTSGVSSVTPTIIINSNSITINAWGAQLIQASNAGVYVRTISSPFSASAGLVNDGTAVFINSSNSSSAYQFQNASGTNIASVDTTNGQLVLGTASSLTGKLAFATAGGGTLTINPTSSASSFTLTLPAETGTVCTNASTSACNTAGALSNVAYLNQDQTFTGKNTFSRNGSGAGDYSLGITGTTSASTTSSLVRIGNAISGGNSAANGGTYIGINEPGSGAGSAADFLNLQNNGTVELQLTSGGNLTVNGTYNSNTFTSSTLQFGAGSAASIASNGSNNLTVDTGSSGGTLALGANAATTNIANSNAAHTINIGAGGTSTAQAVTIGSAGTTSSTLTLQGGNGSTAIALSTGNNGATAGGIVIGNTTGTFSQSISIGTNTTSSSTNVVHIADGATAQNTVTIGSTSNASDSVAISGGSTGGITLSASTTNLNSGTVATNQSTLNLFNATATTVNAFQAATTLSVGANTGTLTVNNANQTLGNAAGTGVLTNNGATFNSTLAVGNDSDGGALGGTPGSPLTAAQSVDVYTSISVNQTTAGQTITLPAPTASTNYGRLLYLSNIGTASFTLGSATISAGTTATLVWSNTNGGASWQFAGADASSILNQNSADQTANFRISGTGRANTSFTSPIFDSITGGLSLGTSTATGVTIGGTTNTTAITLQGAAGVSITLGNAAGSGVLTNNGATLNTTLALGDFATGGSIGSAASTVDKYTSISVAQTTSGQILTINSPTANTTYGRMLYLSNIGSASFKIGTATINPGATASLIWSHSNGGDSWQFAGADAGNLQGAYTNSAGGTTSEIILDSTRSSLDIQDRSTSNGGSIGANLLNVRATAANDTTAGATLFSIGNAGAALFQNSTNSTSAFQIQNANAAQLVNVDTTNPITDITNNATNNLVTNGSFEANVNGWAAKGSASAPVQNTTYKYIGNASSKVVTTAATNDGTSYNITLSDSTAYSLVFSLKLDPSSSSFATLAAGYNNGSSDSNCTLNSTTVVSSGWTTFSCTFTTASSHSGTPYIYIKQTDATIHTFYADAVQLSRYSLLSNASAEVAFTASDWQKKTGSETSVTQVSTQAQDGSNSVQVVTTGSAQGTKHNITLNDSTSYSVIFYAKASGSSFSTLEAGYNDGSANTVCITAQTVVTTGWTAYSCSFTTTSSHSGTPYFYVDQTDSTGRTFFLDNFQLTIGNPAGAYREGQISLNGIINSPVVLQGQSNSTTAFQIQNSAGASIFAVDSVNRQVKIYENGGSTNYALIYYDTATSTANYTANTGTVAVGTGAGAISITAGSGAAVTITGNAASTWKTNTGTLTLQSGSSADLILNPGSSIVSINGSSVVKLGSSAGDPGTCTLGAIVYNSTTNLFRGCQGSSPAWATLSSTTQTLQNTYTASTGSTTPEIKLDSTRAGVDIQDADSTISGVLFAVRGSNAGGLGTSILNVNSSNSTVNIGTTANATGILVLGNDNNSTFNAGTITSAATEIDGAMFYSSSDHNFLCGTAGSWITCNGLLYSNISASTAVNTCSTACAAFSRSAPIPANYCQQGRAIHVIARGIYGLQNSANQTFALGVYYGTDSSIKSNDQLLGTSTSTTNQTNLTNNGWKLDTTIICYDTTHMQTEGDFTYSVSNTAATAAQTVLQTDTGTGGTSVTTTSPKSIYLFPAYGVSNSANTATLQQLIVTGN